MNNILKGKFSTVWFYGAVAISFILVAATWITSATRLRSPVLQFLNLRVENNGAAWWSGILLMLAAIHAFDGWEQQRRSQIRTALAWLFISAVLVMLSLDEVGSLHERANQLLQLGSWMSLLPFAIVLLSMMGFALWSLWKIPDYRWRALSIGFAFLLFACVALLEYVGDIVEWSSQTQRMRATAEEATELLAMLILLKASMANTRGVFDPVSQQPSPTLEAVSYLRTYVLVIGVLVAPILAFVTELFASGGGGRPADWFAAVVFLFAGLAVVRNYLESGQQAGLLRWSLLLLCFVASLSTMLDPITTAESPTFMVNERLIVLSALTLLIWICWALDPKFKVSVYLPVVGVMSLLVGIFWIYQAKLFWSYWLTQYIALGVYFVNSTPEHSDAQQPKSLN